MNLKRKTAAIIAVAAMIGLGLTACSSSTSNGSHATSGKKLSVALAVNGALGDQGFFDDAERGMNQLKSEGHKTETLQASATNPAQWKTNLESISTGNWNLAVAGTAQMTDIVGEVAKEFPNQKFIVFDTVVNAPNVASITYEQNQGSFLAGVLAGYATTDKASFPLSSANKTVGIVGGEDIPVINDFVVGFKAGVKAVDPKIKVLVSYVGGFSDPVEGYAQAKAMYAEGADVVFQAAGGSGIGVLQAAKDANKYAIGVDQNQNAIQPGHVLASVLKHVGNSLVLAVDAADAGKLKFGKTTEYGLANNGVGLDFDNNSNIVPAAIQKKIDGLIQEVIDGKITVPHAPGAE